MEAGVPTPRPARRTKTGNGMENMRERMHAVGGQLELQSQTGNGTRVTFCVPYPQLRAEL